MCCFQVLEVQQCPGSQLTDALEHLMQHDAAGRRVIIRPCVAAEHSPCRCDQEATICCKVNLPAVAIVNYQLYRLPFLD